MYMQIEIVNYATGTPYQSGNGFSILGENGLILGYLQTDKGEHVVEVERYYRQEAVLTHFTSREDVLKFICTFERELPRLHLIYDKLVTHTEVGVFHAFNPMTSYPFHVGADSDFVFGSSGTGKTTVSYAEKDADLTRDYFMKTMNSVLHELIYNKPQGLGYHSLPFLPSMTEAEKLSFLQGFMKFNLEGASPKTQVDPNRPIIQPSDVPYDFADINKIIENATYHSPKCSFGSSEQSGHTLNLTDPYLFNFYDTNGNLPLGGQSESTGKSCNLLSGEGLLAFLKKIQSGGNSTAQEENESPTESTSPIEPVEVPKPRHIRAFDEKIDKKQADRKHRQKGSGEGRKYSQRGERRGSGGNKPSRRNSDHSPKSPYTHNRRKQK